MRLVVFGATGGIGRKVVSQALDQGHEVVAVVRNPDGVGRAHERLKVVKADVLDASTYARELAGANAVIGALGARGLPKGPITLCTDWAKHLVPGPMSITRADVAEFMLRCATEDAHAGQRVTVST